jgi:hypothetical protein
MRLIAGCVHLILRRYNYRMPVSIWAGWAAPAAAKKKLAETVTLENQLLLGKTFSYRTRLCSEKGAVNLIKMAINIYNVFCKCSRC